MWAVSTYGKGCRRREETNHVDVEDRRTDSVIVLIEYPLELHIQQQRTVLKPSLPPLLKPTPLELRNSKRRIRRNPMIPFQPVGRQTVGGPDGRVFAVEAEGVAIEAVDVYVGGGVGGDVAGHEGLVVDVGDCDAGVAVLVENGLPVGERRHVVAWHGVLLDVSVVFCSRGKEGTYLVLVFGLEEEDGAAISDLRISNDLANRFGVKVGSLDVVFRVSPQRAGSSGQPPWESTAGSLGVYISEEKNIREMLRTVVDHHSRSRTSNNIQPRFLRSVEERLVVEYTLGTELSRLALEKSPHDVDRNSVVASCLHLLEHVEP